MNNLPADNLNQQDAKPSISFSPAVAIGHYRSGLGFIWTGLILSLSGIYPLYAFLSTLNDPALLPTLTIWTIFSFPIGLGVLIGGFGMKEKGYQKTPIRVFGISSVVFGSICLLIPVFASLLLASGAGTL